MKPLAAILSLAFTLPALAAYDGPPEEKEKWVAFCVDSRGVYCRCMSKTVDTADDRRLYEWERMFPPAHLACYKKAGFKPPQSR